METESIEIWFQDVRVAEVRNWFERRVVSRFI
jgi:hypothetical protein